MKYLIVDNRGIELPVIFSELQKHQDYVGDQKVVSAGFCLFTEAHGLPTVICWGESVTLNKQSRGVVDEVVILKWNKTD